FVECQISSASRKDRGSRSKKNILSSNSTASLLLSHFLGKSFSKILSCGSDLSIRRTATSIFPNTPSHSLDAIVSKEVIDVGRQYSSLSIESVFVELVSNPSIHHSCDVVDLLILSLLQEFAVTVGVFLSDAVTHGELH